MQKESTLKMEKLITEHENNKTLHTFKQYLMWGMLYIMLFICKEHTM